MLRCANRDVGRVRTATALGPEAGWVPSRYGRQPHRHDHGPGARRARRRRRPRRRARRPPPRLPKNAAHTGAGRSTVTNQRPRAGASATPGDTISIWVDDPAAGPSSEEGPDDDGSGGGGGGSRVPEGPKPTPTAGAA